jgi:protein-tyrosine-phosphatase
MFVCEHGAAKSVVATAYFNKLAAERNLPFRATFRGTSPQDDLSVRAVEGLKADGVAVPTGKPAAITGADVADATHIFAIGCTLPDAAVDPERPPTGRTCRTTRLWTDARRDRATRSCCWMNCSADRQPEDGRDDGARVNFTRRAAPDVQRIVGSRESIGA